MTYIHKLALCVEQKLSAKLPDRFVITSGVFSTFSSNACVGYDNSLLATSPMEDETKQGASEHCHYLLFVLSLFGKNMFCVVALVKDNTDTNRVCAREFDCLFVRWFCHRFQLAVKNIISNHEYIDGEVHSLMRKLSFSIAAVKLRQWLLLLPKCSNAIRRSSGYQIFVRYIAWNPIIGDVDHTDFKSLLQARHEQHDVDQLFIHLHYLNTTTLTLRENGTTLRLAHKTVR